MYRLNHSLLAALTGILLITQAACSNVQAATDIPQEPTPTVTPAPDCSADTTPNFTDYAAWTKVNSTPIRGHELSVDVYVDDLAEEIYLAGSGEVFPVCATIVKTHLVSATSDLITAVTVMVKMPAGYDPEHNDWWWGMYDKEGTTAQMSGKVQVCIDCHQPQAEADYVFSQAVLEAANK